MQKIKCYGFKYMYKQCLHHYFHQHIKILNFMVVLIVHIKFFTSWLINVDNFVLITSYCIASLVSVGRLLGHLL